MAQPPGVSNSCAKCPMTSRAATSSAASPTAQASTPSADEHLVARGSGLALLIGSVLIGFQAVAKSLGRDPHPTSEQACEVGRIGKPQHIGHFINGHAGV